MKMGLAIKSSSPRPSPSEEKRGKGAVGAKWNKDTEAGANFCNGDNLPPLLTPFPPYAYGGESWGEEAAVLSGRSRHFSPRSFLARRGGKLAQIATIQRISPVAAFTLLEVMLAITIFFMAMFAILGLLTSGVRAASLLRNNGPTAGMILAQLSATNILVEGSRSGNFKDVPIYEGYQWAANIREMDTNGLFQADVVVQDSKGNQYSAMSALLYRPDSEKHNKMGLQQQPGQR